MGYLALCIINLLVSF